MSYLQLGEDRPTTAKQLVAAAAKSSEPPVRFIILPSPEPDEPENKIMGIPSGEFFLGAAGLVLGVLTLMAER